MTENQTNQPTPPIEPDKGNEPRISGSPRKRGRFASDGPAPRRPIPNASRFSTSESLPPAEQPATEPAATRRFETGADKPAASKPVEPATTKQPQQSIKVAPAKLPIDVLFERTRLLILALVFVPLCIWASFPAWAYMVNEWYTTDDYSHGFLVIPATLLFLYMRRDSYPGTTYKLDWVGLSPILFYVILRIFAAYRHAEFLDQIAIWFWILSIVWFFYGWRVFLWALPSLCFLVFMFQLPWRVDVFMKHYLQQFAALSAAAMLQLIGETAFPIKNTIRLSTMELGVEAACSGLRFLMSVFAIAFAAVLLLQRPWWQNILILAIAAPLALFVNAVRIAITGYLLIHYYDWVAAWGAEGENVSMVADGWAGKIAIVLALGLFALFIWYLGKVFRQVEI